MSEAYSGTENLHDSEFALINYNASILKLFKKNIEREFKINPSICDFGSGVGTFAKLFREKYEMVPTCVELDSRLMSICKSQGFPSFSKLPTHVEFNVIYTSNVLEHIEDDVEIILSLYQRLSTRGLLLVYVPAIPFLYSDMDSQIGHYRRYSKKDLVKKIESVGFTVNTCTYHDCCGVLASLLLKVFGFNRSAGLGNTKTLWIYDRLIFPVSHILDLIGFRFLIGKNLFLVAVKN
jgi:SAM-dependent methyltransferase